MAYRNGTYIAFHANGNNIPGKTDIDYYNLLQAWNAKTDDDFTMINSHQKVAAVKDGSLRSKLRLSLLERLQNSKNLLLIVGETTKFDNDWVPFEIENAIDKFKLPIIAAYTISDRPVRNPLAFKGYWPPALAKRIDDGTASVIHLPFKKAAIQDAIGQFHHNNLPKNGGLGFYTDQAYTNFGIEG